MLVSYEEYYDLDEYFESLLNQLESIKYLDCRDLELSVLEDTNKYWRFSKLNNMISKHLFDNLKKDLIDLLIKQKDIIFSKIVDEKVLCKKEKFSNKPILTYLEFIKMNYLKSKFSSQSLNFDELIKENSHENFVVLKYRIKIQKEYYNLQTSLTKLNRLKSGDNVKENNEVLNSISKIIKVMEDDMTLQKKTITVEDFRKDKEIAIRHIKELEEYVDSEFDSDEEMESDSDEEMESDEEVEFYNSSDT